MSMETINIKSLRYYVFGYGYFAKCEGLIRIDNQKAKLQIYESETINEGSSKLDRKTSDRIIEGINSRDWLVLTREKNQTTLIHKRADNTCWVIEFRFRKTPAQG